MVLEELVIVFFTFKWNNEAGCVVFVVLVKHRKGWIFFIIVFIAFSLLTWPNIFFHHIKTLMYRISLILNLYYPWLKVNLYIALIMHMTHTLSKRCHMKKMIILVFLLRMMVMVSMIHRWVIIYLCNYANVCALFEVTFAWLFI